MKQEYEDIVKNEVQRAISADEDAIAKLCANYIDNIKAYTQKERVKNKYTGQDEEPDERLMRSIEEKIDIPESRKDDFRREIMNYIGALAIEGRQFDYRTNERLHKALELKLFEDQKDSIKLTSLVSSVVDRDTQEKIDVVKNRMIKNYGYCEICSTDVLNFVASDLRPRRRQGLGREPRMTDPRASACRHGRDQRHRRPSCWSGSCTSWRRHDPMAVLSRALGMLEQGLAAKRQGRRLGCLRSGITTLHGSGDLTWR